MVRVLLFEVINYLCKNAVFSKYQIYSKVLSLLLLIDLFQETLKDLLHICEGLISN